MKRIPRHSEIRITGANGVTHTGTGDGLAQAVNDLGERPAEARWTLTSAGARYLAGEATAAYLDDPSLEGAAKMEARYVLAERLGYWEGQR
jgi:hypothetical protein